VLEADCKIRLSMVSKLESLFPRVRHLIDFIIHCTKQLTCTVSDSYRATIFGDVESLICLSISIKDIHPSIVRRVLQNCPGPPAVAGGTMFTSLGCCRRSLISCFISLLAEYLLLSSFGRWVWFLGLVDWLLWLGSGM